MIDDDRGVSEILGFVLIFALVTSMVAVVFTVGFGGLQAAQEAEQVNNVERAFDVLDDNLKDLYQRDNFDRSELTRATEIKIAGGSVSLEEEIYITIEQGTENFTYRPRPLAYADDSDSQIVYEAGAVIRMDDDAGLMLNEPSYIIDSDRSLLQLVNLRERGDRDEIGRVGTAHIVAEYSRSSIVTYDSSEPVNITVESPRAIAWKRYFESQERGTVEYDAGNDTVVYSFESAETVIVETRIGIRLTN